MSDDECLGARFEPSPDCPIPFAVGLTPSFFVIDEPGGSAAATVLVEFAGGREWPISVSVETSETDPSVELRLSEPDCEPHNELCRYPLSLTHDGTTITSPGVTAGSVIVETPTGQTSSVRFALELRSFRHPADLHVAVVYAALEFLAADLGLDQRELVLTGAEAVTWSNSSLGCPQEGYGYAAALVPGFELTFTHNEGKIAVGTYPVHTTDDASRFVRPLNCHNPHNGTLSYPR